MTWPSVARARLRGLVLRSAAVGVCASLLPVRVVEAVEGPNPSPMVESLEQAAPAGAPELRYVEVEAAPYLGSASGTFPGEPGANCSSLRPVGARLHYAGAAALLRARFGTGGKPEPLGGKETLRTQRTRGAFVSAGVAVQRDRYALLTAGSTPSTAPDGSGAEQPLTNVPKARFRGAARLTLGGDWYAFGLEAGVLVRQTIQSTRAVACGANGASACAVYDSPELVAYPELKLRFGPVEPIHLDVGLGSYTPGMMLQPGAYVGLGGGWDGWEVAGHFGTHDTFHGRYGSRLDLAAWLPLSRGLRLGVGGARASGLGGRSEWEGRLGIEATISTRRAARD